MTCKEIFKKVEIYNEIADTMYSQRARIYFYDKSCFSGEYFTDYKSFSKYIRREYYKDVADVILKADDFIIDYDKTISWIDYFGHEQTFTVSLETVAI